MRPEKTAVVEEIQAKLTEADAAVLTEYRGLSVRALAELRGSLRPANTEYKVFKNTLARLAVEQAGLTDLLSMLEGPVAIAFVQGDAVLAAKALKEFGRANPELVVKGGLLGDAVLTPKDISALADVPPREELLAKLAGGFQAPLTKAAGLFQAFTRNFAYGVKALIDQRGGLVEEDAAAPADTRAESVAESPTESAAESPTESAAESPTESAAESPAESVQGSTEAGATPEASADPPSDPPSEEIATPEENS
jgi:large subunit ribosomal protein L10